MRITRTFLTTAMALGLTLAGATTFAQAPTGTMTNLVVGRTNAIWDVTLYRVVQSPDVESPDDKDIQRPRIGLTMNGKNATNYWKCLQADANPIPPVPGSTDTNWNYNMLGVGFTAPFVQDGRGRLLGKGSNELGLSYINWFWTGNIFGGLYDPTNILDLTNIPCTYVVNGSIKGVVGGGAIMRYTGRAFSLLPLGGKNRRLAATSALYFLIDATTRNVNQSFGNVVALTSQRTLSGGGSGNATIPAAIGDGTWTLAMNFDPALATTSTRLSGTATVTLNSGAVYPFSFTGRYSTKTGQSALLLKGVNNDTGNAKGATLSVILANGQVTGLQGRVAGQIIKQK